MVFKPTPYLIFDVAMSVAQNITVTIFSALAFSNLVVSLDEGTDDWKRYAFYLAMFFVVSTVDIVVRNNLYQVIPFNEEPGIKQPEEGWTYHLKFKQDLPWIGGLATIFSVILGSALLCCHLYYVFIVMDYEVFVYLYVLLPEYMVVMRIINHVAVISNIIGSPNHCYVYTYHKME